ncbi:hypothetical protein K469DRAFT_694484 [Zopfia rhizophila CBS 207.26]|uniref:Uncharacterized protein n=1 Tax=Zopfia rhizophila CBS 207.26 TaxID=1314779 RepID=A0A6A6EMI5_9PEZI|nr:hypothetical protein K469DRAFT_694484 [Zopfia rhizophila CBS 207.26]
MGRYYYSDTNIHVAECESVKLLIKESIGQDVRKAQEHRQNGLDNLLPSAAIMKRGITSSATAPVQDPKDGSPNLTEVFYNIYGELKRSDVLKHRYFFLSTQLKFLLFGILLAIKIKAWVDINMPNLMRIEGRRRLRMERGPEEADWERD